MQIYCCQSGGEGKEKGKGGEALGRFRSDGRSERGWVVEVEWGAILLNGHQREFKGVLGEGWNECDYQGVGDR
jgi:hypothetical protein